MVLMNKKNQLNKQILRSEVLEPKHINMVDELQPEDTSDYLFSLAPNKKLNCFRFKSKFINSLTTFFYYSRFNQMKFKFRE